MKEDVTPEHGWRNKVLVLVNIGRELQIIEGVLRSLNATAVVPDGHVESKLREAIRAARDIALDLDRLRTR